MNAEEYILSSSGLGLPEDGTDHHNNNQAVMNEKVQSLAGSIYEEFESMIIRYDTDVVKSLMPLIVNVLESLDLSYTEIQEYEVELELLKEDNEQLVTQYEREKALRKGAESKNIEFEDNFDGERKDLNVKIESITSTVKMFELKAKNNQEHINRLEEKENEMKREYSKLHDRYTELFKTHIDYMERAKNFLGSEKMEQMHGPSASSRNQQNRISALNQLNRSSGPISFGYTELEGSNPLQSLLHSGVSSENCNSDMGHDKSTNLRNELIGANDSSGNQPKRMVDKGQSTDNLETTDLTNTTGDVALTLTSDFRSDKPDENVISTETATVVVVDSAPTDHFQNEHSWVDNGVLSDEVIDLEGEDTEYITQDPNIGPVTPTTPVKMGLSQTKVETRTGNTLYQELSFQDADALGDVDEGADITDHDFDDSSCFSLEDNIMLVNDNYFGMGKEVENLISENNELLATKNALNIVKDDLIAKVDELTGEHEILREEIKSLQKAKSKGNKNEADDEDVPMAQTQEIYTGRNGSSSHGEESTGRLGIWKFFGNLFSANDRNFENGGNNKPLIPYVNMKYSNEGGSVSSSKGERKGFSSARNNELFDGESLTNARRNFERKEQYKQVRAHVKKDDGRIQAYGWSLPVNPEGPLNGSSVDGGNSSSPGGKAPSHSSTNNGIPVPVPVYCQPLMKKEPGMKIWCAAGVNLTGACIFDDSKVAVVSEKEAANLDAIRACNNELDQINKELNFEGKSFAEEAAEVHEELSSHIWICTSTHSISKVTVIDANDPGNVLESFHVCSSHLLCIASVPGTKDTDFMCDEEQNKKAVSLSQSRVMENEKTLSPKTQQREAKFDDTLEDDPTLFTSLRFVSASQADKSKGGDTEETGNKDEEEKETQENEEDVDAVHRRFLKDQDTSNIKIEGDNSSSGGGNPFEDVEKMSSVLPTMWLGSQSGSIYVHSAVSQWKRCIHSIKLSDSVLCILHIKGRVLVALANGTIAIFNRSPDGQWDLDNYHLLDLGKPRFSIRCMAQVHDHVWCGYRNKVFIIDPQAMSVQRTFDAHPRKESQVRQMACFEDGVWVSIRLDSTLRLYHAHTYQHLQDVDIEPYVSKMLGPAKYGFSFVRITSLLISCHRLWMGTGNGVIISVPFASMELLSACNSQTNASSSTGGGSLDKKLPGGLVRVYSSGEKSQSKNFIPYCSLSQAQLSFHGHRDSVKFFVSVPGNENLANTSLSPSSPITGDTMLVVSGGEGYIDFRLVDDGSDQDYDSHMMVWQLPKVKFILSKESDSVSIKSSSAESVLNSWESNSIGLGPTPGSGVVTMADTSAESDTDTNTSTSIDDLRLQEEVVLVHHSSSHSQGEDQTEEEEKQVLDEKQGLSSPLSVKHHPSETLDQFSNDNINNDSSSCSSSTVSTLLQDFNNISINSEPIEDFTQQPPFTLTSIDGGDPAHPATAQHTHEPSPSLSKDSHSTTPFH
ncbi:SPAG9 [Lepeophtheirus salmonis]|uniref:JNK-interacting protein 3 n=1 Tax=Lepeophtheirus salmonis TaxID=72036 RepID=A0A7R8CUZ0_LEPSM|nr:SPAG9 [Lepeophtheirus salmonis]CAF2903439.1 SPAG9 [Lepeophtheirus salmonis]